ncbi:NADPH-dependent F420 reductase [Sphingobium sp. DEHP117]|uniref:NADPH-dependent F420 reductase n=1 Tax=Sphingobium sp. DEHP117 TaxID=2993436 RepID=UPI0027D68FCA|nr:NADPH-dependent F420 reductase [Sphingobium sp. DEHP117]MDQ4421569.1 NADPH-dependent F420 reductase [Sphingobium sp. DEHP117]
MSETMIIGVIGGTGNEGGGLAMRWAAAGHSVLIGSRDAARAREVAAEMNAELGSAKVSGGDNAEIARRADVVVLAVPYKAQQATAMSVAAELDGKILIDVTAPLVPPKVGTVQLPEGGSAVAALQRELGASVRVVSAFQNISAHHLRDLSHEMDCDVLVCSDDASAAQVAIGLVEDAGMKGWHAGPLANSVASEALTSIMITLNRKYKIDGAGIRITGIPAGETK